VGTCLLSPQLKTWKVTVTQDALEAVSAEFHRLVAKDLAKVAVVAQCLDNQWVSKPLLARMLKRGEALTDQAVRKQRMADARAEYLRALLNSEQVIVNRAFFYNNPVVYRDYSALGRRNKTRDERSRNAAKELLGTGVLVPFLVRETKPGDLPNRMTVDDQGLPAYLDLLKEVTPSAVRLSWNDDDNHRRTDTLLFKRFGRFMKSMSSLDVDGLANDLGIATERARGLRRHLRTVTDWALDLEEDNHDLSLTREMFYQQFVVRAETKPADGAYDPDKPFVSEIKQLIDLRYATNLPDALDRYPLTPANSLHRTALQEEQQSREDRASDPEAMLQMLRRAAFSLVQEPLAISLSGLELHHVVQARRTDEWHRYIEALRGLMDQPLEFEVRAGLVYHHYIDLARRLSGIVGTRRADAGTGWMPVMKVVIEFVGATLSVVYSENPFIEKAGEIAASVAGRASVATVRFVIGTHDKVQTRRQLSAGTEIMKVRFTQTKDAWDRLERGFIEAGFRLRTDGSPAAEDDAGIDSVNPDA
jgi:hypothetical protein